MVDAGFESRPLGSVSLGSAIEALRTELLLVWAASSGRKLRFRPSPVELTLTVSAVSDKSAKAGVKWLLFEAGADLSRELTATHTVKLTLEPVLVDADGRPVEFLIDDAEAGSGGSSPALSDLSDKE